MTERRVIHRLSVTAPAALGTRATAAVGAALLGCAFLLALALGAKPGRVGSLPGERVVTAAATDVLVAAFAVCAVFALFLGGEIRAARRAQEALQRGGRPWWERLAATVTVAAIAMAPLAAVVVLHGQRRTNPIANLNVPGGAASAGHQAPANQAQWPLYAALAAGAVLGVALLAFLYRRESGERPSPDVQGPLREAAERGLAELEGETDPRRAVIRSYAAMESVFGGAGVPRAPAETPEEYLVRILARNESGARAAGRLTPLFERAKFSPHEVDEGMRRDALAALRDLRQELEE